MADLVNWDVARRVGATLAGRRPAAQDSSLVDDFAEFTPLAEQLVEAETGLRSQRGRATAEVVDRAAWVNMNVASYGRLLRPLTDRLAGRLSGPAAPATRAIAGAELGAMLGWMSTRVLGQYDALLPDDDSAGGDVVYYVGPNILALEQRHGFPPRQFRLWIALHEVTHRAQFTGVPWMQAHFRSLVDAILGAIAPDPKQMLDGLRRAAAAVREGRNPLDDGGLVALLAGPEQHEVLQRVQGLMSLLEGHGDVTMDRAGAEHIPLSGLFSETLRVRRQTRPGVAKVVQQLIGLEAKMKQYEAGEKFVAAVEQAGGPQLLARVWERAENLPTLPEIRRPELWLERVRLEVGTS